MTTATAPQPAAGAFKATVTITVVIILFALGASFTHMIDWTVDATKQGWWFGFSNAVISELLPTASFLNLKARRDSGRSSKFPVCVFLGSVVISLCAQLSSTGIHLLGERQFLACLPALAVVALSVMIHGEVEHIKEVKTHAAAAAERERSEAAERVRTERNEREERARAERASAEERAAEVARNEAAVEQARADAARADAERVAAEVRLAAERLEAERLEVGRRRLDEQRAEIARRAGDAAKRTEQAEETGRAEPEGSTDPGPRGSRRSAEETRALVQAALAEQPPGTSRADAVKAIAVDLQMTTKGVRNHVPADWSAGTSRRLHLAS